MKIERFFVHAGVAGELTKLTQQCVARVGRKKTKKQKAVEVWQQSKQGGGFGRSHWETRAGREALFWESVPGMTR